jgi:hypothetical protein
MTETRKIIRVFLASPGDLGDERSIAKNVVDEFNNMLADTFGYQVELMGWEDTVSAYGRPQAVINQDLERCELFIGMMWMRWGTPPDKEGKYTSGFEEEFELSIARRKKTNKPEITMFFKDIEEGRLEDPGQDLNKVIEFKKNIESKKELLFSPFKDTNDFEKKFRRRITKYISGLFEVDKKVGEEGSAKLKKPVQSDIQSSSKKTSANPLSPEGHKFLQTFLAKTDIADNADAITSLEVARFRLLANTISKPGNQEPFLGVHDANIIYSNKNDVVFGKKEIFRLVDCGLKNIKYSNVPLWYWYSLQEKVLKDAFVFKSLGFSEENKCIGALEAMMLVGAKLPVEKNMGRPFFINGWFSDDTPNNVKLSALSYLKHHGLYEDLPLIQAEFDRSNSQTAKSSIEAILSIQLRSNRKKAVETALKTQFETIDNKLIKQVISGELSVDEDLLRLGLKHRNAEVRLACVNKLKNDDKLTLNDAKTLAEDDVASIRNAALHTLLLQNQLFTDEEVKNILVKPDGQKAAGILSSATSHARDKEGEKHYSNYLSRKLYEIDEKSLAEKIKSSPFYDTLPYFVLCERYFEKYSGQLRKNVDDLFESFFDKGVKLLGKSLLGDTLSKRRDTGLIIRQHLVRKGLDVLCRKNHAEDLARVRNNYRSNFVKSSVDEVEYLKKWGEWDDIPYIIKAEEHYTTSTTRRASFLSFSINDGWHCLIAEAIYNIGCSRLEELLGMDMPERVFVEIINISAIVKFSQLSDSIIFTMLNNEKDDIRKSCSLKCIQSFKKSRLKAILNDYMSRDDCRYYNVIHWLDFGVAMPKGITKKAIELISNS